MDSKISQFVSQTGADAVVAKDLLQRTYFILNYEHVAIVMIDGAKNKPMERNNFTW